MHLKMYIKVFPTENKLCSIAIVVSLDIQTPAEKVFGSPKFTVPKTKGLPDW